MNDAITYLFRFVDAYSATYTATVTTKDRSYRLVKTNGEEVNRIFVLLGEFPGGVGKRLKGCYEIIREI